MVKDSPVCALISGLFFFMNDSEFFIILAD